MTEERKTKKVAGVDLSSSSFAYVGDLNDTATWRHPLYVPGDTPKTVNLIKTALHRFADTKGVPEAERQSTWLMIVGAAKCQGIQVQKQAPAMAKTAQLRDAEDREMKSVLAEGELAAERFLKQLGY